MCVNSTCITRGSLPITTKFLLQDDELAPYPGDDNSLVAGPACSSFVTVKTGELDPVFHRPYYK